MRALVLPYTYDVSLRLALLACAACLVDVSDLSVGSVYPGTSSTNIQQKIKIKRRFSIVVSISCSLEVLRGGLRRKLMYCIVFISKIF